MVDLQGASLLLRVALVCRVGKKDIVEPGGGKGGEKVVFVESQLPVHRRQGHPHEGNSV